MNRTIKTQILFIFLMLVLFPVCSLSSKSAQSRRPIYLTFSMHGHSFNDRLPDPGEEYQRHRIEINWLRKTANKYGAKLSFQMNGEYAEWCIHKGHQDEISAFIRDGHTISVHFHGAKRSAELEWNSVSYQEMTHEYIARQWQDHYEWVQKAVPEYKVIRMDAGGWGDLFIDELIRRMEIKMLCAPEDHITGYNHYKFGHHVWNPYRPKAGTFIEEDLSTPYIYFPMLPQLGRAVAAGRHAGLKMTVPHVKRRILMIYLEWLHQEQNNLPDKVWTFGWVSHPGQNSKYHHEVEEMWQWVNETFINKKSARGNVIMEYASDEDVYREYLKWENENPGMSSFSWKKGDPYPYSIPAMQTAFDMAEYDYEISDWENLGVNCHHLTRNVVDDKTASGVEVWVLWKDFGETTIDAQYMLGKQVQVKGIEGNTSIVSAANLTVGENPIFVERYREIRRPEGQTGERQ